MSHVSKNNYFSFDAATIAGFSTGKLADLAFDGKSEPLGLGSLGGVTKMDFAKVVESGKTVITFSTENNMEVHGDLEVEGDLHVDGGLVVHGEITADFVHTGQEEEADEEPAEDEVLLTPQELTVIKIGLDQLQYQHLSWSLDISIKAAQKLVQEIYETLID